MMYAQKLAAEAVVVAIVFVAVLLTLHALIEMLILKNNVPKTHQEYMGRLAALGASAAVITHLVFEAATLNKQYCCSGAACMSVKCT
jgi:uncharacterized membrane protein